MKKQGLFVALCAGALLAGPAAAAAQNMGDAAILGRQMAADQGEIMQARYASQNGSSAAARAYADMLVRDHTNHSQQVQAAASAAGVTPDMNAAQDLTAHAQQDMQTLQGTTGADLDRAFLANMVQDHQMVISETEGAVPQAQNARVRTLLQNTVPVLRRHLSRAQALQNGATGGQHTMGVHKDNGR